MKILDCAQMIEPHWLWETTSFVSQTYAENDEFQEFGLKWFGSGFSFVHAPGWHLEGAPKLDDFPLNCFTGVASRVALDALSEITPDEIRRAVGGSPLRPIVLLRTGHADQFSNRRPHYLEKAPIIKPEVADYLAGEGVRHVAIDLSCDSFAGHRPGGEGAIINPNGSFRRRCHELGLLMTENCAGFTRIGKKEVFFFSLPIRGDGLTTAPCRPIALDNWPKDNPALFDVSTPLMNHWRWKMDLKHAFSFENGDDRDETHFFFGGHGFTHCDAPRHMERNGLTIHDLPNSGLDIFLRPARIADFSDLPLPTPLTRELVQQRAAGLRPGEIVVLRSDLTNRMGYGSDQWHLVAPNLEVGAAEWLVAQGPAAVALDFPQDYVARQMPERHVTNAEFVAHHAILGKGIPFIEDLRDIGDITTKTPFLVAIPLKMTCIDGAPMRVIAVDWS